jgi:hypothetical protein
MRKSNFAGRLQPSLLDEARKAAQEEGVALNQLINVAVAEKLSAPRTERYFAERAVRANIPEGARHPQARRSRQPAGEGGQTAQEQANA